MKSGASSAEKAAKRKKLGDAVIRAGRVTEGGLALTVPIRYVYRAIKAHKLATATAGTAGVAGYELGKTGEKKKKVVRHKKKREVRKQF